MKKSLILFLTVTILSFSFIFYANKRGLSFFEQNKSAKLLNYKPDETISIKECIEDYTDKEKRGELILNENGDVTYKNRVVLTPDGMPLNEKTLPEESITALKIFLIAKGVEPREGCEIDNISDFGEVGCYFRSEYNP